MKTSSRKLALHRDTLRSLAPAALEQANGGSLGTAHCSVILSCQGTCVSCATCGCPTQGQNCTLFC